MKKKTIVIVLCCIAVFSAAGIAVYCVAFNSIKIESVQTRVRSFSDYDMQYNSRFLSEHRVNNTNALEYLNKSFEFADSNPENYCYIEITCKVSNTGKFEIIPIGLIPQKDNDVIGFSEADLKDDYLQPGESREEKTRFVCKRNGMTDDELVDYVTGLKFKLLQKHRHLGNAFSTVSLKDISR